MHSDPSGYLKDSPESRPCRGHVTSSTARQYLSCTCTSQSGPTCRGCELCNIAALADAIRFVLEARDEEIRRMRLRDGGT